MSTDDPGFGGYVPEEDAGTGVPREPGTPSPHPSPPRPPWWQAHRALAIGTVAVVVILGVVVSQALSGSHTSSSTTSTGPVSTGPVSSGPANTGPVSTGPSSNGSASTPTSTGPANAGFLATADAICTQAGPKIQADLSALHAPNLNALPVTTGDTTGLASDFGAIVTGLRGLGNPPVDPDNSFSNGVDDWQQALDLLSPGDTEDFTINYNAGILAFRKLGLKVCSGGTGG